MTHSTLCHCRNLCSLIYTAVPITGIYDFSWAETRVAVEDPKRVLFVDIGGGSGHALLAIQREFPGMPLSRFMLQDLPEVISAVESTNIQTSLKEVQKTAIDFNKEQPVKGMMPQGSRHTRS